MLSFIATWCLILDDLDLLKGPLLQFGSGIAIPSGLQIDCMRQNIAT
jgi:hypothetical protein